MSVTAGNVADAGAARLNGPAVTVYDADAVADAPTSSATILFAPLFALRGMVTASEKAPELSAVVAPRRRPFALFQYTLTEPDVVKPAPVTVTDVPGAPLAGARLTDLGWLPQGSVPHTSTPFW